MSPQEFLEQFKASRRTISSEQELYLRDSAHRDKLYALFHSSPTSLEPLILRRLLDIEVEHYKGDDEDVDCERLYWCAFLLSRCGRVEDVLPIWRAKQTDFDTACGLDIQYVVGPGVKETIDYLAVSTEIGASDALEYIKECQAMGDFEDMGGWRASRQHYFMPRD